MSQPAAPGGAPQVPPPSGPGVPQQNAYPAPQGAPGAPVPGGPGMPPPPPGAVGPMPGMPAPAKRGKGRLIGTLVGVVVVVIVAVIVGVVLNRDDPDNAKVGSCMAGQDENSLKVVDCAKDHDWTVVGKINDKSQADFDADNTGELKICTGQYPETEAEFWKGDDNGGYVLCLKSA